MNATSRQKCQKSFGVSQRVLDLFPVQRSIRRRASHDAFSRRTFKNAAPFKATAARLCRPTSWPANSPAGTGNAGQELHPYVLRSSTRRPCNALQYEASVHARRGRAAAPGSASLVPRLVRRLYERFQIGGCRSLDETPWATDSQKQAQLLPTEFHLEARRRSSDARVRFLSSFGLAGPAKHHM